ncbi:sensor histidine kinase [Nocardia flavorosea]|uniref:histidine kinase n=1 Tax=Nocardia flavorosea TaxID=53429 RepID=A0A846YJI8_9NOCA|nr:HAMP domain-containing sensor histidine kinase [Nocardia flavorosea]NKY59043.1 HAMP domain-containing histidine kinase [Nocardia flavorosea]
MTSLRLPSLRVRITVTTTVIVLAVLACGAVSFLALFRHTLITGQSKSADIQAAQIAADAQHRLENAADPVLLPVSEVDDVIIQLQQDGRVIATSEGDSAGPALPVPGAERFFVGEDSYVVQSAPVPVASGAVQSVVVARSLEDADSAVRSAALLLAAAVPTVSAFVAALMWAVVGRSLRPVERIRLDAESIGADLSRRVDPPAGKDEVARLAATMNRMLDRLESSHRAQQRFVSDASHELRSPVAAIRQHAQVALHHPGATDLASLAGVVESEAARLHDLVDDLLLLARLGEGPGYDRSEVDLDDIVLAEATRLRQLGVTVDIAAVGPARVLADEGLLARAVRNATDNARRHARSRIDFTLRCANGQVVLWVDDDGDGVPESDRDRLFRRFERSDDNRSRAHGGAGLGLAIIAEAARHTGGSARLSSSPRGGARLEINLPEHTGDCGYCRTPAS